MYEKRMLEALVHSRLPLVVYFFYELSEVNAEVYVFVLLQSD